MLGSSRYRKMFGVNCMYGARIVALGFIKSYLTSRYQFTSYTGAQPVTVKPINIEHVYYKLCPKNNFLIIPVRIPCFLYFAYQTAPSVSWAIPNFPAPGNRAFKPSGDQF